MQTPPWWSEVDVTSHPEGPIWCPVAHMVRARSYGPGGSETKCGSRHFAAGAKLYVHRYVGYKQQVEVVGHHRASHRYVIMIVSASWLTEWRAELVYSPRVIATLWPIWNGSPGSKARAEEWARHSNRGSIETGSTSDQAG